MSIKQILSAFGGSLGVAVAVPAMALAASSTVNCADLPSAVASANAGDTIVVTGDCTLTSPITVNKSLTIKGNGGTITTTGSNHLFVVTGNDVTLEDLNVVKTDNANQNIINLQGDNDQVLNSTFSGQYTLAANQGTTRALEISGTANDFTVSGNTVKNLRQPAYINGRSSGTVSNNYVDQTRGWVVEANADVTFTGNTFGTNAVDIAIIPSSPTSDPNLYTCADLAQITRDNDNATIQSLNGSSCAAPQSKDDCKKDGWKDFYTAGKVFKNQGDCVSSVASENGLVNRVKHLVNGLI